MPNYLLEIGCEEIPARFVEDFSECLKENLVKAFKNERLLEEGFKILTLGNLKLLRKLFVSWEIFSLNNKFISFLFLSLTT